MRNWLLMFGLLITSPAWAADQSITLASTTSTQNSGLFDEVLPMFEAETGIRVNVVAVGTGQALRIARNGDADVLLVHHRPSEDAFVADGYGVDRRDVMYNDFVLVGPASDPADIAKAETATEALARIAAAGAVFTSRGDDSGTHKKELELWDGANAAPDGAWYRETGSGMGTTLNIASGMDAYALTDRGTWITFGNKGNLTLLYSGDPALFNPYGVIRVSPKRFAHVKAEAALTFVDWLVSDVAQDAIAGFQIHGRQAFCPDSAAYAAAREETEEKCPSDKP